MMFKTFDLVRCPYETFGNVDAVRVQAQCLAMLRYDAFKGRPWAFGRCVGTSISFPLIISVAAMLRPVPGPITLFRAILVSINVDPLAVVKRTLTIV